MSGDQFKRFTNLQAVAALRGVELRAIRNDAERWSFIATVGPVTLDMACLEDVERWLAQSPAFTPEGQSA